MKHFFPVAIAVLSLTLLWTYPSYGDKPEPQPVDGRIKWVYDYEEGQRLSRQTGKPMFVVIRCER